AWAMMNALYSRATLPSSSVSSPGMSMAHSRANFTWSMSSTSSLKACSAPSGKPLSRTGRPRADSHEAAFTRWCRCSRWILTAARLGYEAVGFPESWSYDMTVLLAEAAARTRRVTLSTGILSVWGRSPATLAMAASTLSTVSGGRFVLGLGASTAQLVEGLHDVPFETPVAKLRRTVIQVRAL